MESVQLIQFPFFKEDNGELSVFEQNPEAIPFQIKRIFNVRADKGSIRGLHAHRLCSQMLICSNGSVEVFCDDSSNQEVYLLDNPNYGLLVPPGVWDCRTSAFKDNLFFTIESSDKARKSSLT